jgi:hypothetical protein
MALKISMTNYSDELVLIFKKAFTLDKVKQDIFFYLNENPNGWFKKLNGNFVFQALNVDSHLFEEVEIKKNDELTIISYTTKLTNSNNLYFQITVAIGAYNEQGYETFTVEKCLAKLKYNYNLTIYDIDFYLTELNKM